MENAINCVALFYEVGFKKQNFFDITLLFSYAFIYFSI